MRSAGAPVISRGDDTAPWRRGEEHLAAADRYVNLKRVRARLAKRAEGWRWSSARSLGILRGWTDGPRPGPATLRPFRHPPGKRRQRRSDRPPAQGRKRRPVGRLERLHRRAGSGGPPHAPRPQARTQATAPPSDRRPRLGLPVVISESRQRIQVEWPVHFRWAWLTEAARMRGSGKRFHVRRRRTPPVGKALWISGSPSCHSARRASHCPKWRHWRSQGDSNPCFRRERATSWAARRWEPRREQSISAHCGERKRAPIADTLAVCSAPVNLSAQKLLYVYSRSARPTSAAQSNSR